MRLVAVVVLVVGCSAAVPRATPAPALTPSPIAVATATASPARATGAARDLTGAFTAEVPIGDRALFVRCSDRVPRAPTVVFESGGGGNTMDWARVVPRTWGFARTCAYDRANAGRSDPTDGPVTSEDVADDLHALLGAAGIERPIVLVGHSLGGLHARVFAARYPRDVAALVFVDPTPPDLAQRGLQLLPQEEHDEPADLAELRRFWEAAADWTGRPSDPERLDLVASSAQAAAVDTLGDMPVIVLHAETLITFDDATLKPVEERLAAWSLDASEEYAALSTDSVLEVVERSGHQIPRDRPDAIVDAIRRVIETGEVER